MSMTNGMSINRLLFLTSIALKKFELRKYFGTSLILPTRTEWSKKRVRLNHPTCFIPRYLLNGGIKKGHKKSGRDSSGRIRIRHKRRPGRMNYRMVDFMRVEKECPATQKNRLLFQDQVVGLAYDPCRSALVAKVVGNYSDRYRIILAATGMKVGDIIHKSRGPPPERHAFKPGDTFPLKHFPKFSKVFNIENRPGGGGQIARAGDGCLTIVNIFHKNGKDLVKLEKSGRYVIKNGDCLGSYGTAFDNGLRILPLGKAGRARRYGFGRGGRKGIARLRNIRPRGRKNMPYVMK